MAHELRPPMLEHMAALISNKILITGYQAPVWMLLCAPIQLNAASNVPVAVNLIPDFTSPQMAVFSHLQKRPTPPPTVGSAYQQLVVN